MSTYFKDVLEEIECIKDEYEERDLYISDEHVIRIMQLAHQKQLIDELRIVGMRIGRTEREAAADSNCDSLKGINEKLGGILSCLCEHFF